MRFLITGAGGFAGSHLADYLLNNLSDEHEVWGCDISGERRHYHSPRLKLLAADLRDPSATRSLIEQTQPDRVYHLAGQAFVGESWADPWHTLETNIRAQVNLCEAILASGLQPRVLILGSTEVYGRVTAADLPLRETCPLRPDSPYGVSKVAQDLLGLQYHLSRGMYVVRVRPFNHIGPRQNQKFVAPAFASQIAKIEAGEQASVIRVGNLQSRRDFTDVRDTVRAYYLALEQGTPGEVYNIGSECSRSIQEMLDILLANAVLTITTEVDPDRLRPSDVLEVVGDASKFKAQTGWAPQIPFEQSLLDLLNYERELLKMKRPGLV